MKTVEFFLKEIPKLTAEMEGLQLNVNKSKTDKEASPFRRQKKLLKKRVEFLKFCHLYVETNPSPDFVKGEAERLINRINMFMKTYVPLDPEQHIKSQITAHKKAFEKEMGIPKIRTQLTTLNFLLSNAQ